MNKEDFLNYIKKNECNNAVAVIDEYKKNGLQGLEKSLNEIECGDLPSCRTDIVLLLICHLLNYVNKIKYSINVANELTHLRMISLEPELEEKVMSSIEHFMKNPDMRNISRNISENDFNNSSESLCVYMKNAAHVLTDDMIEEKCIAYSPNRNDYITATNFHHACLYSGNKDLADKMIRQIDYIEKKSNRIYGDKYTHIFYKKLMYICRIGLTLLKEQGIE